jgi:hypothetical protein
MPSNITDPIKEPRIGPAILSQVTGGPACKNKFLRMPGMTSIARATPTTMGRASIIFSTAVAFAFSISIMVAPFENQWRQEKVSAAIDF